VPRSMCLSQRIPGRWSAPPGRLLFSALSAAALAQPTIRSRTRPTGTR
jgi:hypothetical protein